MSETDLKPCPFCGGAARTIFVGEVDGVKYWAVGCRSCGCKSEGWRDTNKAAAQWNRRKMIENITEELEKCPVRTISVVKAIRIVKEVTGEQGQLQC